MQRANLEQRSTAAGGERVTSPKALTVLSLGWGVQSWTLAAMAALGEIEPGEEWESDGEVL